MSFVTEFAKFQASVHELAKKKGWYDEERKEPELLALIHSEVSEALEEYRNGGPVIYTNDRGKPCGIAVELADIVIRVMDMAEFLGINLGKYIKLKHEFNKTRPYRHGGKKA